MDEPRLDVDRVEVVRRWMELTPEGDWVAAFRDEAQLERMGDFLAALAVPDLEVVPVGGDWDPAGLMPSSLGAEGLIAFWLEWMEPWESFTLTLERVVEGPDAVVVEAVQQGRLRGSSGVVESHAAAVHFFRGDRLARIEFHLDRDAAHRAAGL
jgi:ketosteroid isomerase-like protein